MSIWKCFQMAMSSIVGNKMRSILTMLGIIIGITAVIALVSLMSGMTSEITDAFEEMGIESINVSIQDRSATKEVKPEEMEQLAEEHSDIIAGQSPTVSMPAFIKNGSDTISTQATGVNEYYLGMKKYNITYGRELTYVDVERKQKVCVIGTYIAKEVFGGDALGKSIQITGTPYEVVGILEEQDDSTENSSDNCVYIPYTLASYTNRTSTVSSYVVYAVDQEKVEEAVSLLEALCDKDIGDSDYYTVTSMKSMADSVTDILDKMELMLIAIAAISLVVAGIGIMNIMLVSVTERTREIGIRKSLGAKQKDILSQFVIEAGMLSCLGGVIGIIVGSLLAILAGKLLGMDILPTPTSIVVSFTVSAMIGVFFGYMPAKKAAKLNPIDALRYD
ncbi:ABC transporter permease [Ruminococcus sp.]|uniref:ABC transporter permease n=1 Tax=Ruminococcus sp. TaxID=41978 RepID=UPI003FD6C148